MKFSSYIKDKLPFILSQLALCALVFSVLGLYGAGIQAQILFASVSIALSASALLLEYLKKSRYYSRLLGNLSEMDKKQYVNQILEPPDFEEARIMCDVIGETTSAMNREIADYKANSDEYREYTETWIHEIKTPIAAVMLLCDNNKSDLTDSIRGETEKTERYVEQALFYARSTNVENDYFPKRFPLDSAVRDAVRRYSKQLISAGCSVKLTGLEVFVYSDRKWLDFIIGQIISNSIKYRRRDFALSFTAKRAENSSVLEITDNGTGIPSRDIPRVFEKGFTGENGRRFAKSTGIGLYLCRRLCEKMRHGIELESKEGEGTTVRIIFPENRAATFDT